MVLFIGKSFFEHTAIQDEIKSILRVNPTEPLECDQSLLDVDFDALGTGTGPTEHQLIWAASMNTAPVAAQHRRAKNLKHDPPD